MVFHTISLSEECFIFQLPIRVQTDMVFSYVPFFCYLPFPENSL